ncbi:MAG: hypothetical protein QM754_06005 [Tepidisphaeraceae bacterium]
MPAPPGWLARRPLVAVAVALIVGIAGARGLPHFAGLYLTLATVTVLPAAVFGRHRALPPPSASCPPSRCSGWRSRSSTAFTTPPTTSPVLPPMNVDWRTWN